MRLAIIWFVVFCALFLVFSGAVFSLEHGSYVNNEVIVKFRREISHERKKEFFQQVDAEKIRASYKNSFYTISIKDRSVKETVDNLKKNPDVIYAVPNYILYACGFPDDPYFYEQYNFSMIFIKEAWQVATGLGAVVAVIDSGVSPYGRDGFKTRLLNGFNSFWQIEYSWVDENSHGTHVAGTIGQETNNSAGVAGIAFDSLIMPVKALNRAGWGTSDSVASAIMWSADNGADVINLSLGSDSQIIEPIEEALKYAYDKNVAIIAASGNSSTQEELFPVSYPASSRYAISVGAVNSENIREFYSNGGIGLDVVAPGSRIAQEAFYRYLGFEWFALGWGIWAFSGTSMASAHVAGIAALIKSLHPDWGHEEIKKALIESAIDIGGQGWNEEYGFGLVDAFGAVTFSNN